MYSLSALFKKQNKMKKLYKKALKAYIEMLEIHIDTKTKDYAFHKATEEFYEILFKIAHEIGERHVDLWGKLSQDSLATQKKKAKAIIEQLQVEIKNYAENNELSMGTEDLLGSLMGDLDNIAWTVKSF